MIRDFLGIRHFLVDVLSFGNFLGLYVRNWLLHVTFWAIGLFLGPVLA